MGSPKIETDAALIYIPEAKVYVYLGGFTKNEPIPTKESELERIQNEEQELQKVKQHSLYYQEEWLRQKHANNMDYIYTYDTGKQR